MLTTSFNVLVAVIAGVVAISALFAAIIKRYASPPLIALAAGIAIAPIVGSDFLGHQETLVLEEASRISLAVGLMAAALRINASEMRDAWRAGAVMLASLMPLMWLLSSLIGYLLFDMDFLHALIVGAVVTPTDPILAGSLLTGRLAERYVPQRLRTLVSMESGANDGLAYAFVLLPLLVLAHPIPAALGQWLVQIALKQIVAAALFGVALGYVAGRAIRFTEHREIVGKTAVLVFSTALALLSLSIAKLMGTDGILAVFASGLVFSYMIQGERRIRAEEVQDALDLLFTTPTFVLVGISLPWGQWATLGWKAVVFAVAIVFFRRLPAVAALRPLLSRWLGLPSRVLLAWTGPIGISTVFYAMLVLRRTGYEQAWTLGSLAVFASVLVHGVGTARMAMKFGEASAP